MYKVITASYVWFDNAGVRHESYKGDTIPTPRNVQLALNLEWITAIQEQTPAPVAEPTLPIEGFETL